MKSGIRRLLAVVCTVGVAVPTAAFAEPLNVELSQLVRSHPQIEADRKKVEAATASIGVAEADLYPTVQATGDVGPEYDDTPTTRGEGSGQPFSRTQNAAGLSVTENLFNGFATAANVRIAQLQKELSKISLENTLQQTIFTGIKAYINVLKQKRLVELSRENEATIKRQLNLESERVQRGSGVTVDVLQAKSRLQLAKEKRVNYQGSLQDAISTYTKEFGHAPNIDTMMDPVPPVDLVPSTLQKAVEIAIAENPAVANSGTAIEVARQKQRQSRAELYPSVDLKGNVDYQKNKGALVGTQRSYTILLSTTWNLFTGFSTRKGQAKAAYDYRASKDDYQLTLRKVVEQTRLAWQALLTARSRLDLLENAVNIASEVFDSRKKLREAGKETVINVLDSEREVNSAEIDFTSASYDERTAVYQLLVAMGRLDPVHLGLNVR